MDAASTNGNGEQKVTNALLKRDIEMLTDLVKALTTEVRESNRCTGNLTTRITVVEKEQQVQGDEIKRLRDRDTTGSVITGAMAIIAGIFGALFKP